MSPSLVPFRSLGYPEELSAYVPCKKHYMEMSPSPCHDPLLSFGCKYCWFLEVLGGVDKTYMSYMILGLPKHCNGE